MCLAVFVKRECTCRGTERSVRRSLCGMSWEWIADEKFSSGIFVSVMMKKISGDSIENLKVGAKEAKTNVNKGKI